MTRLTLDDYMLGVARLVAQRSTCDRLSAGAVLVQDKRIIATGYNGAPPGMPHCDDAGHEMADGHCIRTCHAEENCILQSARVGGAATKGATLYCTHSPCYQCFKRLLVGGVARIVCHEPYRDAERLEALCNESGIVLTIGDGKQLKLPI